MSLLEIEDLTIQLPTPNGRRTIVHDVQLRVEAGQVYGIAGESGSGKTMTMLSLLGLLPRGGTTTGAARFDGTDVLASTARQRAVRGREIAMVFQDPMTSLHPMLTVGKQLTEHARRHLKVDKREAERRATAILDEVRIPDPEAALRAYPHEFSGGMRQRIAIAIALMCEPRLLIADEPTTALDVTIQGEILGLLRRLQEETGMAIILITHDLGVVADLCTSVAVMYAGEVVEQADVARLFAEPAQPYTRALLASNPIVAEPGTELISIPGTVPSPADWPTGCHFFDRCPVRLDACAAGPIPLLPVLGREEHDARCIRADELVVASERKSA